MSEFEVIWQDLEEVAGGLEDIDLNVLRNSKFFITGGTGFIGSWLVSGLLWLNRKYNLDLSITILTRKPNTLKKTKEWIYKAEEVSIVEGDVRTFQYPKGRFDYIVHAATESSTNLNVENPIEMIDVIVNGTKHVLEFALRADTKNILYLSSGAVYGKLPPEVSKVDEEYTRAPQITNPLSAYGEGKRIAELLCVCYAHKYGLEPKLARLFAFVGPLMNLDAHFAIGNFIRDGLMGGPIVVKGDGTPIRSYMYASDLVIWLLKILLKGVSCRPYNVGSEDPISIADLAYLVSSCFDKPLEVKIMNKPKPNTPPERYVPSTARARKELGLTQKISLKEGIIKTIRWYRKYYKSS